MINNLCMIFNAIGFVGVSLIIIGLAVESKRYRNDDDCFVVALFGFGLIVARSEQFKNNYNKVRATTKRQFWFVTPFTK